ncbi:hypothetical protein ACTHGU_19695 [Chitinophagaceae bacterium MMS25-I14]
METSITPREESFSLLRRLCLLLLFSIYFFNGANAQNGSPCYTPIAGYATTATAVQSNGLCLACGFIDSLNNTTDASRTNYATFNTSVGLLAGNGVSVRDSVNTFPAGWEAGYVIGTGNATLNLNVLGTFTIQTYNNGTLQESKNINNGVSVSAISGNKGKVYLNFITTLPFDEVRFVFSSVVGAIDTMRIYYATAFDPNCGMAYTSSICYKQIAGPSSSVGFNGGLLNALVTLTNPQNITDGDKTTFGTLTVPAGTPLLSQPVFVSALDEQSVYPAGNKAGFVISYSASLLTANVLNSLSIETYLHGQLQDSINLGTGSGGITLSALAAAGNNEKEVSITTTKPFNEIRLVTDNTLGVNVGSVNIYYAFESGAACTDCRQVLTSSQASPYTGAIQASRTGVFGTVCIGQSMSGTANVVDASLTNFATYTPAILSVGCGGRISVGNGGVALPANTFAGFAISRQGTLLDLNIVNAITINLYRSGSLVASSNGASLLGAGLLNPTSGMTTIGFKSTVPFDEIQIRFDAGLISASLGGTYNIYYAFVVRDDDGDGVADCSEVCGLTQNDAIDTDGDGTPNACDVCNGSLFKSALADTDGDGIFDACDQDSDNDGISDAREDTNHDGDPTNDDADGDGIPNYLDLDSDNDGIPDLYESGIPAAVIATLDVNHDGVIDNTVAVGINGLANILESSDVSSSDNNYTLADTDGDGVPDFVDLDADNDGINDIRESGRTGLADANGDGMVDGPDADRDGIMDSADGNNSARGGTGIATPKDTDGDAIADFRDLDSDNDGINDVIESGNGAFDTNGDGLVDGTDTDGDGIRNLADNNNNAFGDAADAGLPDTDGDGIANFRDLDSDNDGINDVKESGLVLTADANGDGMVDGTDADGDGIIGVADGNSGAFGDASDPAVKDTDGDGIPDYKDLDSDNDGINDVKESGLPMSADANGDGLVDGTDTDGDGIIGVADGNTSVYGDAGDITFKDTDGDGIPDARDLDSDNDGINDVQEGGLGAFDTNHDGIVDGTDTDGDGIRNAVDGQPNAFGDAADAAPADTDGDGVPDFRDLDSDNDTISDLIESGQTGYTDADHDGVIDGPDTDGDGIQNSTDGLPNAFGDAGDPSPKDTDGDGTPDFKDTDSNNDGTPDIVSNGHGYQDMNGDGMVDNPSDPDGDGIPNNDGLDFKPSTFGGLGESTALNVKVLLQGALLGTSGTVMRDSLRANGFIPLSQPYNSTVSTRFTQYGGGEEVTTTAVLNANAGTGNAIVDWVLIELRSSSDPTVIVHTMSALVQRDGDVVGADGNPIAVTLPGGAYYLSVKHRNHLGVMTATPVIISGNGATVDFTTLSDAAVYNSSAQYDGLEMAVINGVKALWAGNVNADSKTKLDGASNDQMMLQQNVLNYPGNTGQTLNYDLAHGYFYGDVNMDGKVKHDGTGNDRALIQSAVLLYPLNTSGISNFNIMLEQIP